MAVPNNSLAVACPPPSRSEYLFKTELLLLLHFLTFHRRSRSNNRYLQTDSGQRKSLLRLAVSPLLGCFLQDDETGEGTMD